MFVTLMESATLPSSYSTVANPAFIRSMSSLMKRKRKGAHQMLFLTPLSSLSWPSHRMSLVALTVLVSGSPSFEPDKVSGIRRIETNEEPSQGGPDVVGSQVDIRPMRNWHGSLGARHRGPGMGSPMHAPCALLCLYGVRP
ncbi:hypothetical protein D5086_007333 [Populus alba]|uniref:Uncharacterized protein n=1 Tax=Populus alba TaxID=43335 RepID=A0ACC4CPB0_POPAL